MAMGEKKGEVSERSSLVVVIGILLFFFIAFFACAGSLYGVLNSAELKTNAIGVVEIKGEITSAEETIKTVNAFIEDEEIKGILVRIDSPGGSVSASQEMVESIRLIKKPVVISMGDMAASGGYYVACAGPTIYANPGTLTGSIGVISQVLELKDLMEFFKVNVHTIKTGELKDSGSPFREFNETDRQYFAAMGMDILEQFVEHVADARKMKKEDVEKLATGQVWTGRKAKELGLIDEIGGMNTALEALKTKAGIKGKYTLVYPEKTTEELLESMLTEGATEVFDGLRTTAERAVQKTENFQYLYR